ncbi:hypothetical protein JCM10213_008853 [Rhodosporidiobolus nylandii]
MCPSRGRCCLPAFLFLLLVPLARAAPTNADLLDYLGGTATGQTLTTVAYTLTMAANETAVLVSCSFDGKASEVGWVGWGSGTAMTDSDIIVLWPTDSSGSRTWTLSHRTASTTQMPTLVGDPNVDDVSASADGNFRVVASLSSSSGDDSPAVVTFERPLSLPDGFEGGSNYQLSAEINQEVIFAYGDKNPGDSAQDTDFTQHSLDTMGASYIDLSASFTADTEAIDAPLTPVKGSLSGGGGSSASSGGGGPSATGGDGSHSSAGGASATGGSEGDGEETVAATKTGSAAGSVGTRSSSSSSSSASSSSSSGFSYSTVILIHGLCAGSAWAIFSPMAVLFARYGRGQPGTTLTQMPWHFQVQGWLVSPLTFIAGGLALWAVSLKTSTKSETYAHKTIGFAFIGALIVQDLVGWIKHMQGRPQPGQPRSLLGWLHIVLGVTLTVVGFYQVHLGIVRYGASSDLVTYGLYGQVLFPPVYLFLPCLPLNLCAVLPASSP